ncbi:MAG TPA: 23S ribosomal RNA methyltransferase Erm [Pyrinomonadaceae bacterium]|jgi:23S rRNA (adenine-N6)-dimethyltransferase|nr:23S ribosomal RNA methyltransferase Erm [Pyrinomonadaceae bacterium]
METRQHKQIHLAQNFLRSPKLVRRLVGMSRIGPSDTVYEIGPGNGIITAALASVAKQVIAIEKDPYLVRRLRERFREFDNVAIVEQDCLAYLFQRNSVPYKMFANIPYNITAQVLRRIVYAQPGLGEGYLVLQKEAARKYSGLPTETLCSILAKPCFEFQILAQLRRTDFSPVPNVDSVLLQIRRRRRPLIDRQDVALYREFVQYGFGRWKPNLRLAFKNVFTYKQWKRLSRDLNIPLDAKPTELTFEQWLGLFRRFRSIDRGHRFVTHGF